MVVVSNYAHPEAFWLFALIPILIGIYIWKFLKTKQTIGVSTLEGVSTPFSYKIWLSHLPFVLRIGALIALIYVLARPQKSQDFDVNSNNGGISIMLALDVSGSMDASDFPPNRLEASKAVAQEFVEQRPNDKIGLVIFSGEAYTQCPVTPSKEIVLNYIADIQRGTLADGTAIGMGLATAVSGLKKVKAKSKIIILLSDGENNSGDIEPLTAAELAKAFGIKVYTIGVGSTQSTQTPLGYMPADFDESDLVKIAEITKGQYFRADSKEKLQAIYKEIDQLEKDEIIKHQFKPDPKELYIPFLLTGLGLLILEFILRMTYFKSLTPP